MAAVVVAALLGPPAPVAEAATAPVGAGFTVTAGDLSFILKQIKIAERHAATLTPSNLCGTLVGPGRYQVPDRLTSYGLRTVDGSCNDLFADRYGFGAADRVFPRLTTPRFAAAAAPGALAGALQPGSLTADGTTSYATRGDVVDPGPRTVSDLVVDQTSTNPAAVAAAQFPVRSQGNPGRFPCTVDPDPTADPPVEGVPAGCVPSHQTLFIPNVTTDVGLSPPYNSLFTFFGQFFDHGVDQTVKGGASVYVPLAADDPLRTLGPDGKAGTGDEVPASQAFMVLTRARNQAGPDGVLGTADDVQDTINTDTPWVDQSQTYASHASHQVFLREYVLTAGRPDATGRLLGGLGADETYPGSPDGTTGMSTWAATKKQAAEELGLLLRDADATDVPMLATDPYGQFLPGPHGLPQYALTDGTLVEGDLTDPVPVPPDVRHLDTPFLTDIAHNADPSRQDCDHDGSRETTPVPDANTTVQTDFRLTSCGHYDDELLDAHFTAGDGRVNENIALSAVHQIFHSEHDRLVADIATTLDAPENAALRAAFHDATPNADDPAPWSYGNRLFQAARFITEMEYQHLVFEEFARKVQPAIRPFRVYSPDVDPAIPAEFAHAVYRFGHSMLDDDVARTDPDGATNDLPLLTAFLNPPAYQHGANGPLTPEQAAGSVVMGSSDQVGNELDEFVVETLRNNLLGLPLDLAALNMARARDTGVPSLNDVRRQIHARTNDAALAPYTSWSDLGQHLKHPESLVNLVAAYGTHPTITSATTLAGRRAAAKAIVDPTSGPVASDPATIPADAAAFMFGTDSAGLAGCDAPDAGCRDWSDVGGTTSTGLDRVDLWVGGLAEATNNFGGLLGSTFNYVFQKTLEDLQDHDRFYYLLRTPGLNLRTQLEGNSFAEMIQRNTDGTSTLKADAFATADCKFQLAALAGTPAGFTASGGTVADDTVTECDESLLLTRSPDGTISYRQRNTVDPSGINAQGVYNGTPAVDRVRGGNDNDTVWGGAGGDVVDGQGGDDVVLGGDGDDVVTDLDGADVLKGGPGDDALDGGPGDDLFMSGDGQDFVNGGANDNVAFAGPGTDFVIAGQGADGVLGDGGDDWVQGGSGQDLLQGDHGAPFFDDPAESAPGNDVLIGQVGENDYDAEGGDDLMSQNAAVDRNAGAGGFDWAYHQHDTVGGDDDLQINNQLAGVPIQVVVNRDRWQETEADSGSAFDDVIRGDDTVPRSVGGAGFAGCDALDQAGLDRIAGLDALVPPLTSTGVTAADVAAVSASGTCPLRGPVWGEGNILLGGGGSDSLTGRGADDIIDGDKAVSTWISVRTDPADPGAELGRTALMEGLPARGDFGPGTTGMTLQRAVFAGLVDPARLVVVREITAAPTSATDVDTAVFSGPRSRYTITATPDGALLVTDTAGVDSVRGDLVTGVERLRFADATVVVAPPAAPTGVTAVGAVGSATVTWTLPAGNPDGVTSFDVLVLVDGVQSPTSSVTAVPLTGTCDGGAPAVCRRTVTGLTNGTAYTFQVVAVNPFGRSPASAPSAPVRVGAPAPTVTSRVPTPGAAGVVTSTDVVATFSADVAGVGAGTFQLRRVSDGALVPALVRYTATTRTAVLDPTSTLAVGAEYEAVLTGGAVAIRTVAAGSTPLVTTTWRFTTDGTAPTVITGAGTLTAPTAGATGTARRADVTTEFSEGMLGVSGTTVRLRNLTTNTFVPAVVSQATGAAGRTRAVINPTPTLSALTRYQVELVGGATALRDLSGNPLVSVSRTFTTGR